MVRVTRAPGDATHFAEQAVDENYSHVIVLGGDGTIREVAQALAGSSLILIPVPVGTANLLAHELGLDSDLNHLPYLLENGLVKRIDLGTVFRQEHGKRVSCSHFVLMAGIGMDAVAVRGVNPYLKRWLGWGLYILAGFWNVVRHQAFEAKLHFLDPPMESVTVKAWVIVIGNARAYGIKGIRVTTHAKIDDGLLDICVFQSQSLWHFIGHFFKVLAGRHLEDKEILYFQAKSFKIETEKPIPVQLDGDLFGETPLSVSVSPGLLNILVPKENERGLEPPLTESSLQVAQDDI